MIKRVYRSKLDIENLSRLRTSIPRDVDKFDYKGVVVNKPWGYEYLMFENSQVAIWILNIKEGYSTSMHCHPTKRTSFAVLCGEVVCSNLEGWTIRREGEGLLVDEAAFHSTKAVSQGDALVMEIESPPNKKDLVRLKDEYGRKDFGYEDKDKMTNKTSNYEYVDFHNLNLKSNTGKKIRNCKIRVQVNKNTSDINKKLQKEFCSIICLLQGKILDHDGNVVLSTGDIAPLSEIKSKKKLVAFGETIYLTLSYNDKKN
ncbi:MAG: hypothetical protein US31_C0025G0004 [Berkelbacteria bacterium GW2011_GWA1_36_9]|uniref:Cupin 2 conserved barrel domain-containing protein n=2 Tax=Bacteria candidate phyla TaxID=1783234 RepID=A0A0G0HXX8_9BACT|nr:MAG: hypothetical protein US31_C0025G0004 [Berkelbacteria bacterium GW2011_GWA1_36_9]KKQ91419.1 MAG: hypothetical protein UT17_C0008G0005 [Candidatus Woesebacteria bacterium GW2011_GWB1_39_10]OGW74553.1 MAG: hypothetical protein A3J72_00580 [Nitrospirae bacterium RIFCSPHIGHO2_02_FULL_40_19]